MLMFFIFFFFLFAPGYCPHRPSEKLAELLQHLNLSSVWCSTACSCSSVPLTTHHLLTLHSFAFCLSGFLAEYTFTQLCKTFKSSQFTRESKACVVMNWWYLKEGEFWIASLKCCNRPTNFKRYFRVCKWLFSYFFLWWVGLWIPHESFSVFLYIPWPGFPPYAPSSHSLNGSLSLSCTMFPLFTFVLCWLDLDKPNSSDPWYLVLALAFYGNEQICGSMLSLSLPFAAHSTLTFLPIWQTPQRSVQCSFLPANYHAASTTLPPVFTNTHLCTTV